MEPIISARNVAKRYRLGKDNFVDALRGATLDIGQGEMVAIIGPSGSGKSTLMHIVGCLDSADAGEVILNGRPVHDLGQAALTKVRRGELGFIFQGYNLIPTLSALDNVALAAEYAGQSRKEAIRLAREGLALVGLDERERHLPTELSGGQQQRVAIARALVNRPAAILGDEPTGNLDSTTSSDTIAMMRRVSEETGTTFVLVTHDLDVAESCDRTITMRDGLVVDEGRNAWRLEDEAAFRPQAAALAV